MKIVCDSCATKYSIADEKVRGKVFKIRCKKCSHIIVVRGGEGGAGDGATTISPSTPTNGEAQSVESHSPDAVWHLVIDREQVGPLTSEEIRAKFQRGEIDVETYGWRDGFADWLRLGSIDEFRDLEPRVESSSERDGADLFGGSGAVEESGGELFSSAAQTTVMPPQANPLPTAPEPAADMFGAAGGLFGAPSEAEPSARPTRTSSPAIATASAPSTNGGHGGGGGDKPMTGQRNENSVLFSLNNLQALANGPGRAAPKTTAAAVAEARAGFANSQTEGSGLIDILAMAASTLGPAPVPSGAGRPDDLPAFSSAPVFSTVAAPILMPTQSTGLPKWMYGFFAATGLAIVGLFVVGYLALTSRKAEAPQVALNGAPTAAPGVAAAPAPPTTTPAAPGQGRAAGLPAATGPARAEEPKSVEEGAGDKRPHRGHDKPATPVKAAKPGRSEVATPAPAAPPPEPVRSKPAKAHDELDELLNAGAADKPKRATHEEAAAPSDNLPEQLDKGAIVGGMGRIKSKVQSCYDQFKVPGTASVSVTIVKSGRVSGANVTGSFGGTPTGQCIERAVRSASFPQFKGAAQTITYPFMLR